MDSPPATHPPHAEYSARLDSWKRRHSAEDVRHHRLGIAKLAVAFAAVLLLIWTIKVQSASVYWLLAAILAFLLLDFSHGRVVRSLERCSRIIAFYDRCLARLENRWMGRGETGG